MLNQTINIAKISCWVSFFLVMTNWVWRFTIFSSTLLNYISFIVPLGLFFILLALNSKEIKLDITTKVWIPWMILILMHTMINLNWERFSYHFICMALIILSVSINMTSSFPKKLALLLGIFSVVGITVQFILPDLHSAMIEPLYTNDSFDGYGLRGFTYQVAQSAEYILLFEMIWLYFYKNKVKRPIFWIILIISILAIFLTGKRMHAMLSIIVPLLIFIISQNNKRSTLLVAFVSGIIGIILLQMFINNAANYGESVFLHRFADTVELSEGNEDITSNRNSLAGIAIKLWLEKPIFGIGDSNYAVYTGAEMAAHNAYLQTLCEQGIIGFTLWIIPLVYCFVTSCSIFKKYELSYELQQWLKLSLFCQLYFILYGFTGNPTINFNEYVLYFFAIAILSDIHFYCLSKESVTLDIHSNNTQHNEYN